MSFCRSGRPHPSKKFHSVGQEARTPTRNVILSECAARVEEPAFPSPAPPQVRVPHPSRFLRWVGYLNARTAVFALAFLSVIPEGNLLLQVPWSLARRGGGTRKPRPHHHQRLSTRAKSRDPRLPFDRTTTPSRPSINPNRGAPPKSAKTRENCLKPDRSPQQRILRLP